MNSEIDLPRQGKRSEVELVCVILNSSVKPVRQTYLIYSANINAHMFKKIVPKLIKKKLLEEISIVNKGCKLSKNPKITFYAYKTTEKGLLFVKKWKELNRLWRE